MSEVTKFESWAIVEVMGHSRFAGYVTEQALGGASFVRVDVPEIPEHKSRYGYNVPAQPAFTKLLGAGSIFAITPCSEDVARKAAFEFQSAPVTCVDLQPVKVIEHVPGNVVEYEGPDEEEDDENDDDIDDTRGMSF